MKKILWIIFLGLFVICGNAYAATSLCVYKEGKNIHFVKQSSRKNCDGYALLKKNNPKLYKRIKWRFGSKSSSNNYGEPWSVNKEENHFNTSVEEILYFITVNHNDLKWDEFVKKTIGFNYKNKTWFRENNSTANIINVGGMIGEKLLVKKEPLDIEDFQSKPKKTKTKKVKKIQIKTQKLAKYNQSELELIKRFKNYEKNCEPVESELSLKTVICIKVTDVLDLGKFREIQSFPEGMLKKKLNWTMLSKKAGQEVYALFVKRGPQYHARYPGAMILGMSWYEIFYLNQLKKNKKVIERFVTFGPDDYNKYKNRKDPINSIKAKNFPKKLFQEDVLKISKLINNNKSKIKMREALGFSNEDKIEDVIKGQWILGTFLNNDKLKAKKVILDPELKKRKILIARYKTALTKYKKKLEEKSN